MENHRHRRAWARGGLKTAFEAAFGAGKNDIRHALPLQEWPCGGAAGARGLGGYIGSARKFAIASKCRLQDTESTASISTTRRPRRCAPRPRPRWPKACAVGQPLLPHAEGRKARAMLEDAPRADQGGAGVGGRVDLHFRRERGGGDRVGAIQDGGRRPVGGRTRGRVARTQANAERDGDASTREAGGRWNSRAGWSRSSTRITRPA